MQVLAFLPHNHRDDAILYLLKLDGSVQLALEEVRKVAAGDREWVTEFVVSLGKGGEAFRVTGPITTQTRSFAELLRARVDHSDNSPLVFELHEDEDLSRYEIADVQLSVSVDMDSIALRPVMSKGAIYIVWAACLSQVEAFLGAQDGGK